LINKAYGKGVCISMLEPAYFLNRIELKIFINEKVLNKQWLYIKPLGVAMCPKKKTAKGFFVNHTFNFP
jgi:hypothetical protein